MSNVVSQLPEPEQKFPDHANTCPTTGINLLRLKVSTRQWPTMPHMYHLCTKIIYNYLPSWSGKPYFLVFPFHFK